MIPAAVSAPPPTDPPCLRVGPGGDIPVAPPLAMAVLVVGGFGVSYATGVRGVMFQSILPKEYCIPARTVATLAIAAVAARTKRKSKEALVLAGTKACFKPVSSVASTGPYTKCRHPMYWALLSLPAIAGIVADNAWVAIGSNVLLWIYLHFVVVAVEERFLLEQLGDSYKKYCASVKRWGLF